MSILYHGHGQAGRSDEAGEVLLEQATFYSRSRRWRVPSRAEGAFSAKVALDVEFLRGSLRATRL
jgi:hypothetical protein